MVAEQAALISVILTVDSGTLMECSSISLMVLAGSLFWRR